jgi:hypothetical protein
MNKPTKREDYAQLHKGQNQKWDMAQAWEITSMCLSLFFIFEMSLHGLLVLGPGLKTCRCIHQIATT